MNKIQRHIISALFIILFIGLIILSAMESWLAITFFLLFFFTLTICAFNIGKREQLQEINTKLIEELEESKKNFGDLVSQNNMLWGLIPKEEENKEDGNEETSDDDGGVTKSSILDSTEA